MSRRPIRRAMRDRLAFELHRRSRIADRQVEAERDQRARLPGRQVVLRPRAGAPPRRAPCPRVDDAALESRLPLMTSASMSSSSSSSRSAMGRPRSTRSRPSSTRSWLNRTRPRALRRAARSPSSATPSASTTAGSRSDPGVLEPATADERRGERGGRLEHGGRVTHPAADRRSPRAGTPLPRPSARRSLAARPARSRIGRSFGWIGRDEERLLEEADGALGRPEVERRDRPRRRVRAWPGRRPRRPRARPERPPGGDVVARRARRPARPRRAIRRSGRRPGGGSGGRAGQRPVGDLADERLDEARTCRARASAGRSPGRAARLRPGRAAALERRPAPRRRPPPDPSRVKRLAEDRGVLEQRPVGRVEPVEPRGDERLERLRDGQLAEIADGLVVAVGLAQPPVGRPASGRSRPRTAGCHRRGR